MPGYNRHVGFQVRPGLDAFGFGRGQSEGATGLLAILVVAPADEL